MVQTTQNGAKNDDMQCPDCETNHSDWSDEGIASNGPNTPGVLDLWECGRCGFVLEGTRL